MVETKLTFGTYRTRGNIRRRFRPLPSIRRVIAAVNSTSVVPRGNINEYAKIDDTSSNYVFFDLRY